MSTQTAERLAIVDTDARESKGAVVAFQTTTRLPYSDMVNTRFGIDRGGWKVLTEAIFPGAKSVDAIVMALAYCQARKLDVFKRPVHIVPTWSSAAGAMVETIWPGIAEIRTTAFRTGNYAGCDEAEFGPTVTEHFTGKVDVWTSGNKSSQEKTVTVSFPEWCRLTIYRVLDGRVCKFVGPKVKWIESYATIGKTTIPNDMWESRPEGQLEKCAEAAALRRAFPEELGNDLTAEEMHGRHVVDMDTRVAPAMVGSIAGPPDPDATATATAKAGPVIEHQAATVAPPEPDAALDLPAALDRRPKPVALVNGDGFPIGDPIDVKAWLNDLDGALSGCEDMVSLGEKQRAIMAPMKALLTPVTWARAEALVLANFNRING